MLGRLGGLRRGFARMFARAEGSQGVGRKAISVGVDLVAELWRMSEYVFDWKGSMRGVSAERSRKWNGIAFMS